MTQPIAIEVRTATAADRSQVLSLAPRLTEGVAPWREAGKVFTAVQGWLDEAMDTAAVPGHAVFVAVTGSSVVGEVAVRECAHFSGQVDAYVGELAVAAGWDRRGVGSRLMAAAEEWGAGRGLSFLTLETGAANQAARQFYAGRGYREEDVRLTKDLRAGG